MSACMREEIHTLHVSWIERVAEKKQLKSEQKKKFWSLVAIKKSCNKRKIQKINCSAISCEHFQAINIISEKMKFGNYNLTTASAERHNRQLFLARLKKVKNTSNYIVGKFNHQINTIRKINRRKATRHFTDSPLSYRASLFDNRTYIPEKCRELREKLEHYRSCSSEEIYDVRGSCEKYQPDDFHRPGSSLFERKSPYNHCVFDKVKFSRVNNAITGKRTHRMLKNVYFTIKSNQCSNLSNLYESMYYETIRDYGRTR